MDSQDLNTTTTSENSVIESQNMLISKEEEEDFNNSDTYSGVGNDDNKDHSIESLSKKPKKGIIYMSRLPPFMPVSKIRHYMSHFGDVGRIYLVPEDLAHRKRRLQAGGSKKELFIEGWVEFEKKKVAKLVATNLNNAPVGGPKRHNFWRDDIWNIRYLPRFKWHDLMEYLTRKRRERDHTKTFELLQAKKETSFYLDQVVKKRQHDRIRAEQAARRAKRQKNNQQDV